MGCCGSKKNKDDNNDSLDNVVVETGSYRGTTAVRSIKAQAPQWGGRDGSVPRTVVAQMPRVYDPQPNLRPAPEHVMVIRDDFGALISAVESLDMSQDELDGRGGHHWEENRFFQIFFSAMDNKIGFGGILRRWEKASQEATESGEYVKWSEIWKRKGGYINTLDQIRVLVQAGDKRLPVAERHKLREWAGKVVSRRKKEYEEAERRGKADPRHLKALETWKQLDKVLKGQC